MEEERLGAPGNVHLDLTEDLGQELQHGLQNEQTAEARLFHFDRRHRRPDAGTTRNHSSLNARKRSSMFRYRGLMTSLHYIETKNSNAES